MNKLKIVVAILGIVIIAGSVLFKYKKSDSVEQILSKVFSEISSQKFISEKVNGSFVIKDNNLAIKNNLPVGVYPKINFSISQVANSNNWAGSSLDMRGVSNIKFSLENFMKDPISAEADFIFLNQMLFYSKLKQFTGVPIDLSSIKGKWWKVDIEALVKNFAGAEADKLLESVKKSKLSKEKITQLEAIVKKYKSVARIEKIVDAEIEGSSAYHFSVVLDKTQLANMIKECLDVLQKDSPKIQEVKTSDIEKFLKSIDMKSIELFVQKNNYLPVQVKFSADIWDGNIKNIVTMDMSVIISSSNSIEIKAPADSTDILYLLGPILQSSLESARQKAKDATLKAQ